MDTIFIRQLETRALIGVYPSERESKQRVVFDLEMGVDIGAAAESDDVANTLDYQAVAERVSALAAETDYALIEALAAHVADRLLREFPLRQLELTLTKPDILQPDVGVRIRREAPIR